MCSWNDTPKRKHGPTEWFVLILAVILLIALAMAMSGHESAQGQTIPPTSTPMMSSTGGVFPVPFTPTPLPIVTLTTTPEPYHSNVYLPLIFGGE